MNARLPIHGRNLSALGLLLAAVVALFPAGCGPETPANPRDLLLAPGDFPDAGVTVLSISEEQSRDGPSALVELQGPGFRALQSVVLFESREQALSALDGIRGDQASRGVVAGPGEPGASGVLEHTLGNEEAASVFFVENRGLARLTVTGPERGRRLAELTAVAREKMSGG